MTPLEIAAKAYWNADPGCLACGEWDGIPPAARIDAVKAMRAALLALAEAPLPGQVLNVGAMALTLEGPQRIKASQAFSAMLRKIAEDRS